MFINDQKFNILPQWLVRFDTSILPHLDADHDAPVPDHFDKGHSVIRVLVQRLMEEDHPTNAAVDAIVCTEEYLPVLSAVLLCVLHSDLGQPLSHAACE